MAAHFVAALLMYTTYWAFGEVNNIVSLTVAIVLILVQFTYLHSYPPTPVELIQENRDMEVFSMYNQQ